MSPTLDLADVAPEALDARDPLLVYLHDCSLPEALLELVKLRVSQLNGCAYCVDKHTRALREAGTSDRALAAVVVWRDAPFFSERERVALAWAEAVTRLGRERIPESLHEEVAATFSDREVADLTLAVSLMNAWNRLSVALHREVATE